MNMMVIAGAGGQGRESFEIMRAMSGLDATVAGYVDDGCGPFDVPAPFLGPVAVAARHASHFSCAVGIPRFRENMTSQLEAAGLTAVELCHPDSTIGKQVEIGPGATIQPGARITSHVTAGCGLLLNVNAVLSHDCVLGDFVTVSPQAALNGNVTVGDRTFIGTGAVAIPGVRIGSDVMVGAGAVVIRDVPDNAVVVGVPARVIRHHEHVG